MTLPQLLIPILMAAPSPAPDVPAAAGPSIVAPAADTPAPVQLEFPLAGYRINAIESAKKKFYLSMSLPGSGNGQSSPLVKIRIEPTMKERPSYQNINDAKTLRAHNGDTIVAERAPAPADWMLEYTTEASSIIANKKTGSKEHIYRRMVFANGVACDVSATAPDARWPELGPKLKACVDSFELSSTPAAGQVAFPGPGFRINKLDGAVPVDAHQELLSPGGQVAVGVEPYAKTLKDYQAEHKPLARTAFGQFKMLTENAPNENTLVTEYVEEIPADQTRPRSSQLLLYEKVVLAHGQLYWAAGLHWDTDKAVSAAQVKACVESLEAIPIPAPTPVPVPVK